MDLSDLNRVDIGKEAVQDRLQRLLPGVFLATAAYSNEDDFRNFIYPEVVQDKLLSIKTPDTFNDTQVHVALVKEWDPKFIPKDPKPSTQPVNLVFSFRGTEPWQACDWLQDLNYNKRPIDWWPTKIPTKAHDGFLFSLESCTEYRDVTPDGVRIPYDKNNENDIKGRTLYWAVEEVIKKYKRQQSYLSNGPVSELAPANLTRIVVVGHSLGGAIATVASVWASVKLPEYIEELKGKHVTCITIGCPRVGDKVFAHEYFRLMEKGNFESHRIVNNFDLVPAVPLPSWGFRHVGEPIWLWRVRSNWACDQFVLTESVPPTAGINEVTSRPHGYGTSISDHFHWHYNTAMAQAVATTIVCSQEQFSEMESNAGRLFRGFLTGPVAQLQSLAFDTLGKFVVALGASYLVNEEQQVTRIPGPLYRLGVNMLFFFFTVPLWLITHVTYWLES